MVKTQNQEQVKAQEENQKRDYTFAVGRRREAIARVRLYSKDTVLDGTTVKKGEIVVNKKPAQEYFGNEVEITYREPLITTNTDKKFAVSVLVAGGGKKGQLEALVLGISRALDKIDREKFRSILKKRGFLSRDARVRERRKVGMGGKSRRRKQSPKR